MYAWAQIWWTNYTRLHSLYVAQNFHWTKEFVTRLEYKHKWEEKSTQFQAAWGKSKKKKKSLFLSVILQYSTELKRNLYLLVEIRNPVSCYHSKTQDCRSCMVVNVQSKFTGPRLKLLATGLWSSVYFEPCMLCKNLVFDDFNENLLEIQYLGSNKDKFTI